MNKTSDPDRKITINSIHWLDGQKEDFEESYAGRYIYKDRKHYLFFRKTDAGSTEQCRIIYDMASGILTYKKSTGSVTDLMQFSVASRLDCSCHTPMGLLQMQSETKKLRIHANDNSLDIFLSYSLYSDTLPIGDYELRISAL